MAMVINITGHSAKSLLKAAKAVERYRDKLIDNNEVFLEQLLDNGMMMARDHLSNVADDYDPPDFEADKPKSIGGGGNMSATLSLVGEQAAFVEFGAGIHYNGMPGDSPHPLGVELGYTIGSYGMGQGRKEHWYYKDGGTWKITEGTPAAMPLFHAKQAIEDTVFMTAKEAFRS